MVVHFEISTYFVFAFMYGWNSGSFSKFDHLKTAKIWLDTTHKNKTAMWKRIWSKKIRKNGNGNVFQKLIKTVDNIFGKN